MAIKLSDAKFQTVQAERPEKLEQSDIELVRAAVRNGTVSGDLSRVAQALDSLGLASVCMHGDTDVCAAIIGVPCPDGFRVNSYSSDYVELVKNGITATITSDGEWVISGKRGSSTGRARTAALAVAEVVESISLIGDQDRLRDALRAVVAAPKVRSDVRVIGVCEAPGGRYTASVSFSPLYGEPSEGDVAAAASEQLGPVRVVDGQRRHAGAIDVVLEPMRRSAQALPPPDPAQMGGAVPPPALPAAPPASPDPMMAAPQDQQPVEDKENGPNDAGPTPTSRIGGRVANTEMTPEERQYARFIEQMKGDPQFKRDPRMLEGLLSKRPDSLQGDVERAIKALQGKMPNIGPALQMIAQDDAVLREKASAQPGAPEKPAVAKFVPDVESAKQWVSQRLADGNTPEQIIAKAKAYLAKLKATPAQTQQRVDRIHLALSALRPEIKKAPSTQAQEPTKAPPPAADLAAATEAARSLRQSLTQPVPQQHEDQQTQKELAELQSLLAKRTTVSSPQDIEAVKRLRDARARVQSIDSRINSIQREIKDKFGGQAPYEHEQQLRDLAQQREVAAAELDAATQAAGHLEGGGLTPAEQDRLRELQAKFSSGRGTMDVAERAISEAERARRVHMVADEYRSMYRMSGDSARARASLVAKYKDEALVDEAVRLEEYRREMARSTGPSVQSDTGTKRIDPSKLVLSPDGTTVTYEGKDYVVPSTLYSGRNSKEFVLTHMADIIGRGLAREQATGGGDSGVDDLGIDVMGNDEDRASIEEILESEGVFEHTPLDADGRKMVRDVLGEDGKPSADDSGRPQTELVKQQLKGKILDIIGQVDPRLADKLTKFQPQHNPALRKEMVEGDRLSTEEAEARKMPEGPERDRLLSDIQNRRLAWMAQYAGQGGNADRKISGLLAQEERSNPNGVRYYLERESLERVLQRLNQRKRSNSPEAVRNRGHRPSQGLAGDSDFARSQLLSGHRSKNMDLGRFDYALADVDKLPGDVDSGVTLTPEEIEQRIAQTQDALNRAKVFEDRWVGSNDPVRRRIGQMMLTMKRRELAGLPRVQRPKFFWDQLTDDERRTVVNVAARAWYDHVYPRVHKTDSGEFVNARDVVVGPEDSAAPTSGTTSQGPSSQEGARLPDGARGEFERRLQTALREADGGRPEKLEKLERNFPVDMLRSGHVLPEGMWRRLVLTVPNGAVLAAKWAPDRLRGLLDDPDAGVDQEFRARAESALKSIGGLRGGTPSATPTRTEAMPVNEFATEVADTVLGRIMPSGAVRDPETGKVIREAEPLDGWKVDDETILREVDKALREQVAETFSEYKALKSKSPAQLTDSERARLQIAERNLAGLVDEDGNVVSGRKLDGGDGSPGLRRQILDQVRKGISDIVNKKPDSKQVEVELSDDEAPEHTRQEMLDIVRDRELGMGTPMYGGPATHGGSHWSSDAARFERRQHAEGGDMLLRNDSEIAKAERKKLKERGEPERITDERPAPAAYGDAVRTVVEPEEEDYIRALAAYFARAGKMPEQDAVRVVGRLARSLPDRFIDPKTRKPKFSILERAANGRLQPDQLEQANEALQAIHSELDGLVKARAREIEEAKAGQLSKRQLGLLSKLDRVFNPEKRTNLPTMSLPEYDDSGRKPKSSTDLRIEQLASNLSRGNPVTDVNAPWVQELFELLADKTLNTPSSDKYARTLWDVVPAHLQKKVMNEGVHDNMKGERLLDEQARMLLQAVGSSIRDKMFDEDGNLVISDELPGELVEHLRRMSPASRAALERVHRRIRLGGDTGLAMPRYDVTKLTELEATDVLRQMLAAYREDKMKAGRGMALKQREEMYGRGRPVKKPGADSQVQRNRDVERMRKDHSQWDYSSPAAKQMGMRLPKPAPGYKNEVYTGADGKKYVRQVKAAVEEGVIVDESYIERKTAGVLEYARGRNLAIDGKRASAIVRVLAQHGDSGFIARHASRSDGLDHHQIAAGLIEAAQSDEGLRETLDKAILPHLCRVVTAGGQMPATKHDALADAMAASPRLAGSLRMFYKALLKDADDKDASFEKVAPDEEAMEDGVLEFEKTAAADSHKVKVDDMWWQGNGYLFIELSWDPKDMEMHGSDHAIKQAIISTVKGMESDKEKYHLGYLGRPSFDSFDTKSGFARVVVKASSPGSVRERRTRILR